MKVALIILTFDGVETFYCGVGAITQYYLASMSSITDKLRLDDIYIEGHVAYSEAPSNKTMFSPEISQRTKTLCQTNKIRLIPLPHGRNVPNPFGIPATWPTTCGHASQYILKQLDNYDQVIVLAFDTPFAGISRSLPADLPDKLSVVWIAHSTGRIWNRSVLEQEDLTRDEWEKIAINSVREQKNCFLGAISKYMERHLIEDWKSPANSVLPFINGVSHFYLEQYVRCSHEVIISQIRKFGIPSDRPYFISFARAQWYKGLDEACRVGSILAKEFGIHAVIMALPDGTPHVYDEMSRINAIVNSNKKIFTYITDYPTELPRCLMQWRNCCGIGVLSRREPFGLIPSEYRVLGPVNGIPVVSNNGGLPEQVTSGVDGIVLQVDSAPKGIQSNFENLCREWKEMEKIEQINSRGYKRTMRDYDISSNIVCGLKELLRLSYQSTKNE